MITTSFPAICGESYLTSIASACKNTIVVVVVVFVYFFYSRRNSLPGMFTSKVKIKAYTPYSNWNADNWPSMSCSEVKVSFPGSPWERGKIFPRAFPLSREQGFEDRANESCTKTLNAHYGAFFVLTRPVISWHLLLLLLCLYKFLF